MPNTQPIDLRELLLLVSLPFFLDDIFYMTPITYAQFLRIDYTCRLLSLGFLGLLLLTKRIVPSQLGLAWGPTPKLFAWTFGVTLICAGMAVLSQDFVQKFDPEPGLAGYLPLQDCYSPLQEFNYYVGLWLVALSEEAIYRGLALSVLKQSRIPKVAGILLTALFFTAIHWGTFPLALPWIFVYGVIFMVPTLVTGSIFPSIIAHYCVNAIVLNCP